MPKTKASPARSQGGITTPKRKTTRGSRSLCSPALSTASGRLSSLIEQFKDKNMESFALSPLNGKSVLNDNTEIEEPRRKSWWKKLDENSQDVMEVLEDDNNLTVDNVHGDIIDHELLSQEKKNYTLDLPESSGNGSFHTPVLPQRRLFTHKENQPQNKYGNLIDNRESLAKLHKTNTINIDKTVNVETRQLFQNAKRSKPIFPAALLIISPNKTATDKTRENALANPKPPVKNLFGNRPANKRKNMFENFIMSESEDEIIPEIQPKVFGFRKKLEQQRRISSVSKGREGSPTSSNTTDIEMDFRTLLPSSTMVENQLEENMLAANTPIKRARLSKLSEAKESEAGTLQQTNITSDKTKQSNKSVTSKNKSTASAEIKDKSLNSSRITRSLSKNASKREENVNTSIKQNPKGNKSKSKISSKENELDASLSKSDTDKQSATLNKSQNQNKSRTKNSPNATENEIESKEHVGNVVNVINNITQDINKSTNKSMPNTSTTIKSVNEKERTVTIKVHGKAIQTGSNDVEQNEQEDDEHNFTLNYENDDDEVIEEADVQNNLKENQKDTTKQHNTVILEKESRKTEINESNSTNKSLQKIQKPGKTVEQSIESQTEQYSADDNVDGHQEQEVAIVQNQHSKDEEVVNQENDGANISGEYMNEEMEQENENEVNVNHENEEKANESENNLDEVDVSQENEEEINESQKDVANESQVAENEENESEEEDEEDNKSQEVEAELNESQGIEEEANESQEIEEEENESQEIEEETNESQEIEEEANESQEIEEEENETQEIEEEANESQEIDENAHESQIVEDDDAHDEEMNEDEEEAANKSQEVEASESESVEIEDDQQMDDSDEADKAIATDPEISDQDDNQADEMEVDDDEQEFDESEQNEHGSQMEEQNEMEPNEEIEESPDLTHDTTGRYRTKDSNKSPEVILHDKSNQMDSFTAKGRNTSVRKTKSMIKNLNIRPSLAPPRDSTGFSDGARNSSTEGSGWDSHRTTRKTLRQTFGKDFTPRKSLRALVMEKSAKRQAEHLEMHSETVKFPLANSTEMPEDSNHHVEDIVESDHEVSRRTRQTTLETYLQKMKEKNMDERLKMAAAVRNSFKNPVSNSLSFFKVPNKPAPRRSKPAQSKPQKQKSIIPLDELPSELIEDMKYKPPKRFRPPNACWITKRLYKFLENKLEAKYDYKARVRAEKLVETIYNFAKELRRHHVAPTDAVDVLKHEFARLEIVRTHFEFYEFFHEFMPRGVRVKVNPDIVNNIPLPRHGVFSDILRD